MEVIRRGAADIANVYVTEAGGLLNASAIFAMCEAAGMPCMIGSMPEFGIGTAAQIHLGVAMTNLGPDSDTCGVLYHQEDLLKKPLRIEDGFSYPPEGPGPRGRGRHEDSRVLAPGRDRRLQLRTETCHDHATRSLRSHHPQRLRPHHGRAADDLFRRAPSRSAGHTIAAVGPRSRDPRNWQSRADVIDAKGADRPSGLCRCASARERADLPRLLSRRRQQGRRQADRTTPTGRPRLTRRRRERGGRPRLRRDASSRHHDLRRARQRVRAGRGRATRRSEVGIRCSLADPYLWDDTEVMDAIPGLASDSLARACRRTATAASSCSAASSSATATRTASCTAMSRFTARAPPRTNSICAAKALADREGVILNNHIGFDLDLAAAMERHWGKPRFIHLAEIGVLGPNTTFVHMNLIRDEEIDPIVNSGLSIVWCPLAYCLAGTPLRQPTRMPEMKKGVHVALGTDSARQSSAGDAGFLRFCNCRGAGPNRCRGHFGDDDDRRRPRRRPAGSHRQP